MSKHRTVLVAVSSALLFSNAAAEGVALTPAPSVCPSDALARLEVAGLAPGFSSGVTAYRVPVPPGGAFELTTAPCDPEVSVFVQSNPVTPGRLASVWVGDGVPVEVVLYRNWREVNRYTLALDPNAAPAPPAPAVTALDVPGLFPDFDPMLTEYRLAPTVGGPLPVTVTVDDPSLRIYVQSTAVRSGESFAAWAPPDGLIDVVIYRDWTEVARYTLHVLPGWEDFVVADPPGGLEGARFVDETTLRRFRAAGLLAPDSGPDAAPDAEKSTRQAAEDTALVAAYLQRDPEAGVRLGLIDPPDPDLSLTGDPPGEADPPGVADPPGEADPPEPDLPSVRIASLAGSLRAASDLQNVRKQHRMLRGMFERAGSRFLSSMPSEVDLDRMGVDDLTAVNAVLLAAMGEVEAVLLPLQDQGLTTPDLTPQPCVGGHPADVGDGSDHSDLETLPAVVEETCKLRADGLLAQDHRDYTNHLSCVRAVGHRDATSIFNVVSALESAYSKSFAQRLNLSEQKVIYRTTRATGWPPGILAARKVLSTLVDHGFNVPFEADWQFNPSRSRDDDSYANSCVGYAEACSDTVHQGASTCHRWGINGQLCGWTTPDETGGVTLYTPGVELWNPDDTLTSIELVRAALIDGREVLVDFGFDALVWKAGAGSDRPGVVQYHGQWVQGSKGGVQGHVVGYIDDDDLLDYDTYVLPTWYGNHGASGYLIVRMPYGPCYGDGGYLYVPYSWMERTGTSAIALDASDFTAVP